MGGRSSGDAAGGPEISEGQLDPLGTAPPVLTCRVQYEQQSFVVQVSNISERGMFIPAASLPALGSVVSVHLVCPGGEDVVAEGEVRSTGLAPNPIAGIGGFVIRFTKVSSGASTLQALGKRRTALLRQEDDPGTKLTPLLLLPELSLVAMRDRISRYPLSPLLESFIREYEAVGMPHRNRFLWKSTRMGMDVVMLPSVNPDLKPLLNDIKTLGAMADVLLDDLADEKQDRERLETMIGLFSHRLTGQGTVSVPVGDPYLAFASSLWERMWDMIERLPRYHEFCRVLQYDWHQVINSMRYSLLVNQIPALQNAAEHDAYVPHNMHMMCNATLDLMCSPGVAMAELGPIRKVALLAQELGRIGNMVTTWEREIMSRDFTSGVFAHAVDQGVLSVREIESQPPRALASQLRHSGVETKLLLTWERKRAEVLGLRSSTRVDLDAFAEVLDEMLAIQVALRGII
ncbi:PilZ domain-containing protein [Polyangium sp. 6x1]|uniref:PilZ domain-containing protein n=1 Tax=Polyangium sp. 6x1 TaxID=3042689 RepID=UPI0024822FDA|nr:PilZ domain-containing protein [Polyangium sp. 6x1]MDI1443204.1 PilZ domain-containing protein [Polyangium sp. 6x1]